jgi:hypothetical protein
LSGCEALIYYLVLPHPSGPPPDPVFFTLPMEQRYETFPNYSLEKQYEIYIYSVKHVHSEYVNLGLIIAREGSDAVRFLKEKLRTLPPGVDSDEILFVCVAMQHRKYYDVASDAELIALLARTLEAGSYRPGGGDAAVYFKKIQRMATEISGPPAK